MLYSVTNCNVFGLITYKQIHNENLKDIKYEYRNKKVLR